MYIGMHKVKGNCITTKTRKGERGKKDRSRILSKDKSKE